MARYIALLTFTDQGATNIKKSTVRVVQEYKELTRGMNL